MRRRTNHTPPIVDSLDLSKAYKHLKIVPSFPLSNIQFYPSRGSKNTKNLLIFLALMPPMRLFCRRCLRNAAIEKPSTEILRLRK